MEKILHVQQGDWQTVESNAKPALVDFWAEWCAPCRALVPTFEKLAEKYGSDILFAKVNVDECPELSERYGIRSIPTILLLDKGKVIDQLVGARPYQELAGLLEKHTAAAVKRM